MKRLEAIAKLHLAWAMATVLVACGGGGGSDSTSGSTNVVQGTAAVGSPVTEGKLSLRCVAGDRSATTDDTGRYQIDATGLTMPCTMVLTGGKVDHADSAWTLSTVVTSPGVANLTPWTHLVVARLLGADPAAVASGMATADLAAKVTAGKVEAATAGVRTEVGRLLGAAPDAGIDPIGTAFTATAGNGMDDLLVQVMTGLRWTAKTLPQAAAEIAAGPLKIAEVPKTCRPAVLTGFSGSFDDVLVQVPYDAKADAGDANGGGAGGSGGGAGGGAGAGAGGSLGQFVNAIVRVERVDGSLLGEAVTDKDKGLVTVVPCRYQGPLHLVVKAKADGSSQYYEESIGKYAAFPAGSEMNSVVPSVTKNLGITLLTEAAWQYIIAKHGVEGWKSVVNINEANTQIGIEFNKFLPKGLQVSDITRLPFLVGGGTKAGSIDTNLNGIYGVVSSGMAKAAGLMRTGDLAPALKLVRQLGRDLCDGNIDLACNGVSIIADSKDAAYLPQQFGETLNRGVGDIAAACGTAKAGEEAFRITQISVSGKWPTHFDFYNPLIFLLRSDGRIFSWQDGFDQAVPIFPQYVFNRLFPQAFADFAGLTSEGKFLAANFNSDDPEPKQIFFAPEWDGVTTAISYPSYSTIPTVGKGGAWPNIERLPNGHVNFFPYYATAESSFSSKETQLGNIVSIALANYCCLHGAADQNASVFYAVTADGNTYAWGMGLEGYGPPWTATVPSDRPIKVQGLPPVTGVVGAPSGVYAIDRQGHVWTWRYSFSEDKSQVPTQVTSLDAYGPIQQISCGWNQSCIALTRSGKLLAWGTFGNAFFPKTAGALKNFPITEVILPQGRRPTYSGASGDMVYALLDDGTLVMFPGYPTIPKLIDARKISPPVGGISSATCTKND